MLARRAAATPDALAVTGPVPCSWSTFARRVGELAWALRDAGVEPGECVAILGPTEVEWALADQAVQWAGAISVGLYSTSTAAQIAGALGDCRARVVFVGSAGDWETLCAARAAGARVEVAVGWGSAVAGGGGAGLRPWKEFEARGRALAERHGASPMAPGPDDTAIVIYTSGTTGRAKGAMLSHRSCVFAADAIASLFPLQVGRDHTVSFLPMPHATERVVGFYTRIRTGIATRFVAADAAVVAGALREGRPTVYGCVPRFYEKAVAQVQEHIDAARPAQRRLLRWALGVGADRARRLRAAEPVPPWLAARHAVADALVLRRVRAAFGGRVRVAVTGAASIDPAVLDRFAAFGMPVYQGYGMTECAGLATINTPAAHRLGSVGRPIPGFEVRLAADGEVLLRSEAVFQGYLNMPDESAAVLDRDGWLHTGDVGRLEDGYLWITDRKKDLIVTAGGKNIAPAAIEARLSSPLFDAVIVIGEARPFVAALLGLNVEAARRVAGAPSADLARLADDTVVRRAIARAVAAANQELAEHERVRRVRLLPRPLSLAKGELTPTLKVRRATVLRRFTAEADSLYGAADGAVLSVDARSGER